MNTLIPRRSLALIGSLVLATSVHAQSNGTDVLKRMHDKYDGKWYKTLSFTQKTTMAGRGGGPPREQTWYESLSFESPNGAFLRIDTGDPALGNGSVSTADSTWVVRSGKMTRASGSGNPFIPLIENVYLQPVPVTVKQLEPLKFDLSKVTTVTWQGRPAWAVGVTSVSDSLSPQFWVDKDRLVLVRMLVLLAPNAPPYDIHLDNLVETGGGWLATKVTMLSNGTPQQTEEYYGWKTGVKFDPKLFDVNSWSTAQHWAKP